MLTNFLLIIPALLCFLILTAAVFHLTCAAVTVSFFRSHQQSASTSYSEPVSILIPVCGAEEKAMANWSSFCNQNYPDYEVVFGVMDPEDSAVPLLRVLLSRQPRARLVLCQEVYGINHQVSNLIHLVKAAAHETVVFCDSDMRVGSDYLATVTAPLANPQVGVVTCGYVGKYPLSIGSAMASLGRCVDFFPSVLVARALDGGMSFALGATIVTRKPVLQDLGGLGRIVNRIGSDYDIGNLAVKSGYQVELSSYILDNDEPRETLAQVYRRELRWARTIRNNRGSQFYGMLFCHGPLYSLLLVLVTGFAPWAVLVALGSWGIRLLQALMATIYLDSRGLTSWFWLLPLREALSFVVWLQGCFGHRVWWRGRWLWIGRGGMVVEE